MDYCPCSKVVRSATSALKEDQNKARGSSSIFLVPMAWFTHFIWFTYVRRI